MIFVATKEVGQHIFSSSLLSLLFDQGSEIRDSGLTFRIRNTGQWIKKRKKVKDTCRFGSSKLAMEKKPRIRNLQNLTLCTDKKENQIFLIYKEIQKERLQSLIYDRRPPHIWFNMRISS